MENLNQPFQILTLMDFSKASYAALKSAVNLAKITNGTIEILHVGAAKDIAEQENQMAAMRSIYENKLSLKKKLSNLTQLIQKEENVPAHFTLSIGNIKNEVNDAIQTFEPDVVVLGKRKKKVVNFLGDGVTKHLLGSFKGGILLAGEENTLETHNQMSLGVLESLDVSNFGQLAKVLEGNAGDTIKRFKIRNEGNQPQLSEKELGKKVTTFEFEPTQGGSEKLADYITKSQVQLLCVQPNNFRERAETKTFFEGTALNVNVPILVLNN